MINHTCLYKIYAGVGFSVSVAEHGCNAVSDAHWLVETQLLLVLRRCRHHQPACHVILLQPES